MHNVLHLNEMLLRLGKWDLHYVLFESLLKKHCSLFIQQLFPSENIMSQFQVFFPTCFTIPNIVPQSAILGFIEESQDQHNIIFNHILLIYKHVYLSRNFENLNLIGLKNDILYAETLKEKIAQNNLHK